MSDPDEKGLRIFTTKRKLTSQSPYSFWAKVRGQ
jgi:hypothetical protein